MPDIADRDDLIALLRRFYREAFKDELIGPVFTDVVNMDLAEHLPVIADFWEATLLGTTRYRRNAFKPHQSIHAQFPLGRVEFDRWIKLWNEAVDELYSGPQADRAKRQAENIAESMVRRLNAPDDSGPSVVRLMNRPTES